MKRIVLWSFAISVLVGTGCRKEAPAVPAAPASSMPLEVAKDGGWLFTYATPEGAFVTADAPDQVPPESRGVVRAINPNDNPTGARSDVFVLDVAKLLEKGKTQAKRVSRDLFETQALALLPPGASSILADRPNDADAGAGDESDNLKGRQAAVVLYGTSWCGACRTARQYFIAKNIPFVDKDVEKDPAAASELQEKASRLGVSTDRVPILDVRGRLLIGFDPQRVEALLGDVI